MGGSDVISIWSEQINVGFQEHGISSMLRAQNKNKVILVLQSGSILNHLYRIIQLFKILANKLCLLFFKIIKLINFKLIGLIIKLCKRSIVFNLYWKNKEKKKDEKNITFFNCSFIINKIFHDKIWLERNTLRDLSLTSATFLSIYYHFAEGLIYLTNHQFCDIYNKYIIIYLTMSIKSLFLNY